MYAMLTGKLPYTAEPFHITTLYNKMKKNEMNPIPDHLSSCRLTCVTCLCDSVFTKFVYNSSESFPPSRYRSTSRHFKHVVREREVEEKLYPRT